jgi:hypothetical protein
MPRFLPAIFLAALVPWLARGTLVEVCTLWVSITEAVSSGASFLHAGQAGQVVVELGEGSLVAPGGVVGVALPAEFVQRLADGGPADREAPGERVFAGQPATRLQSAAVDLAGQDTGDALMLEDLFRHGWK